mgnify:FL=1
MTAIKQQSPAAAAGIRLETLMHNYVRGKDGNRPLYMDRVFAPNSTVSIRLNTDAIAFPAELRGLDMIKKVLVREFSRKYENIFTFYLDRPSGLLQRFSCGWLVAMTEIATGRIRIGCGRFDWAFHADALHASELQITIDLMLTVAAGKHDILFTWLLDQSYPWADVKHILDSWPPLPELAVLRKGLRTCAEGGSQG